ncbi:branched-chain amino acid transporter permease [Actinocorallia sp. A-T 12471]|uniref:branched-chain amino acid transporter permease n=1 Tax=Actinocorallia sp. A-T 12471 TaxID=3089813 RepID=UPI0029D03C1F|nr:AzlD domain-containing protein [Actinocorallia sp. A-T 12471]MDX6741288.1 AzlD domain-containing protein [Actinocorallia sp. A-T 12471]
MPTPLYLAAAVGISAAITWGLRALPFAVLSPLRRSAALRDLSLRMPVGVMLILALYTLRGVEPTAWRAVVPVVVGLAAAVALHLRTRNAVVSVIGATALHVALATALHA